MPRRDPETLEKKLAFVRECVKNDPEVNMNQVSKDVKKKFGTMLAFDKLRTAFLEAGGKITRRGGGRSTAGTVRGRPAAGTRQEGRRQIDRAGGRMRESLNTLAEHIVVVRHDDGPEVHGFKTKALSTEFVRRKLAIGIDATRMGYYTRQALEIAISL